MVKTSEKEVKEKSYYQEIKSELKKVKWPTKKEMLKYTISTLVFVILFAVFFIGVESCMAFIKGLIG